MKKNPRTHRQPLAGTVRRARARLYVELLEDRTLMSNGAWLAGLDGPVTAKPQPADALTSVNNNTGSSSTAYFTQSETTLVAFGNTVVIGFNDSGSNAGGANKFTGFARSTDGGAFIDGGTLPTNPNGDAGDPVMAHSDATGRIFLATLQFSGSGIDVFHSDDGGANWSAPVQGAPGVPDGDQDKEWITVDNFDGLGKGNVYLMERDFVPFPSTGNGIYFFRSTDNGETFGPNGGTLIASGGQGAFVAVAPNHEVYAFWIDGFGNIRVRKSTDQGATFSASSVIVVSGLLGGNGDLGLVGRNNGENFNRSIRSNSFPHVAVNPVSGDIYVTYNNRGTKVGDKADVFMTMSTNGGANWSTPVKVNDDTTTNDQWQPTIAVTPDGLRLGIFYYSRQEDTTTADGDPVNNQFKYYGRIGTISGSTVTFALSSAVSSVASKPEVGRDGVVNSTYMGDYNQAVATSGAFHVVWSDNRDDLPGQRKKGRNAGTRKDPNVYYEKIAALGPQAVSTVPTVKVLTAGSVNVDGLGTEPAVPQASTLRAAGAASPRLLALDNDALASVARTLDGQDALLSALDRIFTAVSDQPLSAAKPAGVPAPVSEEAGPLEVSVVDRLFTSSTTAHALRWALRRTEPAADGSLDVWFADPLQE